MAASTTTSLLTPSVLATAEAFKNAIAFQEAARHLIGRRRELYVLQVCIVTKKHPMLYGAPGVAKSMSVDGLMMHLPELSKFKTQAYKASPPEQFLGPISIKGMAEDQFVRIIDGKLADCEVGIVDEISRAPRAVLPAFQGIMVEREFDSGMGVVPVPMQSFIGTANHIPDDPELEAFFDRWTFKLIVKPPQSQDEFKRILRGALERQEHGEPSIPPELLITRDALEEFQVAATKVHVPDLVLDVLAEMWSNVTGIGVTSSPRRYTDLIQAVRSVALLDGRDEVAQDDLQIAADSLWNVPDEYPEVYAEITKFASDWIKEKVRLLDDFNDEVTRLGQLQTLIAAGSDTKEKVKVDGHGEEAQSITEHALRVNDGYGKLRPLIERHIADATGQDKSELEAVLAQMDAGRSWISQRLLGGLPL